MKIMSEEIIDVIQMLKDEHLILIIIKIKKKIMKEWMMAFL